MNVNQKKSSIKSALPFIVALVIIIGFVLPIPYYIEEPGTTEDLKEIIQVKNKKDQEKGAFYLTTVGVRRGTIITTLVAKFSAFKEVVDKKELMGNNTTSEYNRIQKYYMDSSQNAAVEQALKLAHTPYKMDFKGIYVLEVNKKSNFKQISVGDTITAVNNKTFKTSDEFVKYVKSRKVGEEITISFVQDGQKKEEKGKLIELSEDKKPGIGIALTDHTEIKPSVPITIDSGDIGGPSAGLMFTLEIYSQLVHQDIRKGHKIAGTGTINTEGVIGRIGGIDKKVVTASQNGIEIFFAPDDEITKKMKQAEPGLKTNYQEAKEAAEKINTKMKIVPVKTVQDALNYLKKMT